MDRDMDKQDNVVDAPSGYVNKVFDGDNDEPEVAVSQVAVIFSDQSNNKGRKDEKEEINNSENAKLPTDQPVSTEIAQEKDGGKRMDDKRLSKQFLAVAEPEKDDAFKMGVGQWRPDWLQKFNSIRWFMFLLAIFSLAQGIVVAGLVTLSIQSVEREFGFSSKISGIILASNDAGALIVVSFVSFFGSKSKPKWMASGALVSGFGGFLFALPKVLVGKWTQYEIAGENFSRDICSQYNNNATLPAYCVTGSIAGPRALNAVIFILAQLLMGAGTGPIRTLGPAYLDENVDPKSSPIYLGIWFASLMMGPGLGFTVGSRFLNIYTDIKVPEGSKLSVDKPGWVGCWWLGFVTLSGIFVAIGALFALFPKQMRDGKRKRDEAIERGELPAPDKKVEYTVKGYLLGCLKLCCNRVFMLGSFGLTVKTIYAVGMAGFMVKIIVIKFGISQVKAGTLIGVAIFIAMTGGVMGGAYIMRKIKVKIAGKTGAIICTIVSAITLFSAFIWLIPGCNDTNLAGKMVPYNDSTLIGSLETQCNLDCSCSEHKYLPVCGSDGITYHSPCYAGCKSSKKINETSYFGNCSCIPAIDRTKLITSGFNHQHAAKEGKCDRSCKNLYLFFCLLVLGTVISFLAGTPHKIMMLRCVPDNQRAFSLGVQYVIMKGFSFMPGPIILGAIVDSFCITWSYNECGVRKSCFDYDIEKMSHSLLLFSLITQVLGTIMYAFCWKWYPQIESNEVEDNLTTDPAL